MKWLTIGSSDETEGIKEIRGKDCVNISLRESYECTLTDFCDIDLVYGTLGSVNKLYRSHSMPGNWLDLPNMRCQVYYAYWSKYLLNWDFRFYPLGYIYENPPWPDPIFMRPDSNFKPFPAMVYDAKEVELLEKNYDFEPVTSLVVVSSVKEVDKEYRLFMRRGKFISGSMYANKEEVRSLNIDHRDDLIDFAESIPQYENLPEMYALDLTETPAGIKLVELTCFNAAGWYDSDYEKLIYTAELEVSSNG